MGHTTKQKDSTHRMILFYQLPKEFGRQAKHRIGRKKKTSTPPPRWARSPFWNPLLYWLFVTLGYGTFVDSRWVLRHRTTVLRTQKVFPGVRGLQRTRGYRWITHPLSYSRWEGYQWIELNEYIKVTGCPREVTNTVNVGDGVKTLFICNWQVLKQLLFKWVKQYL